MLVYYIVFLRNERTILSTTRDLFRHFVDIFFFIVVASTVRSNCNIFENRTAGKTIYW
jgi:hypothetical protein